MSPSQKENTGVTEKRSIYDFVSGQKDIGEEIWNIAHLFESEKIVNGDSLEEFINGALFLSWNGRGTYITSHQLKTKMMIVDIQEQTPSELQAILYLEYVLNMILLFMMKCINPSTLNMNSKYYCSFEKEKFKALIHNVNCIISQLNLIPLPKTQGEDIIILVPKDPMVSEAAEIVEKPDVKLAILEYNHITNRGNLTGKRKILYILSHDLEPKRPKLEKTSYGKTLVSDLFFLFNTLDIRHNTTEDPIAVPAIQTMPKEELLEWYDTTYRLYLTAVLLHDYSNEEQQAKIKKLKSEVKSSKKAVSNEK